MIPNYDKLALGHTLQQDQPEAPSNLIDADAVRDDFVREIYRVLDADTTNDRANAIIDAFDSLPTIQQEQLEEVDLEKEIARFALNGGTGDNTPTIGEIARHFYGLRNRALEEAARHVYESWMGGTMDDVRRDMAELGKVLNARKEE